MNTANRNERENLSTLNVGSHNLRWHDHKPSSLLRSRLMLGKLFTEQLALALLINGNGIGQQFRGKVGKVQWVEHLNLVSWTQRLYKYKKLFYRWQTARRIIQRSVKKVTKHGTIPYVRYAFLRCPKDIQIFDFSRPPRSALLHCQAPTLLLNRWLACLTGSSILVLKLAFSPDPFPRYLPLSL